MAKTNFMDILSPKKTEPTPQPGTKTLRQQEIPGTDLAAMAEKQTVLIERVLSNSGSADPDQSIVDLKALTGLLEGLARKTVVVIFAMGKVLTEVKAVLPHGDFVQWVEENCPFMVRTGQHYMAIYERYKDEPRRALEALSITEAYVEAGVKKLMAPSEDDKAKIAGADQMSTDGLPLLEDYKHIFKQPPASGIDLKRYRIFTHSDGAIYACSMEMGMIPICNLFVNQSIDNPDYQNAVVQVHKDVCMATEAYYYRIEQLEDAGLLPKPADLRMGSMMRATRNVTPAKPVAKKVAKKAAKPTTKKGGKK